LPYYSACKYISKLIIIKISNINMHKRKIYLEVTKIDKATLVFFSKTLIKYIKWTGFDMIPLK
jgi:hypothetical protein